MFCCGYAYGKSANSSCIQMVEMNVRMHTKCCEQSIRRALSRLKGVESVDVDLKMNKVTVMGYVDKKKVLKVVRRTGKRAELWHYQEPHLNLNYRGYNINPQAYANTYNYEFHGYNNITSNEYNVLEHGNNGITYAFSDENPNSCSIM